MFLIYIILVSFFFFFNLCVYYIKIIIYICILILNCSIFFNEFRNQRYEIANFSKIILNKSFNYKVYMVYSLYNYVLVLIIMKKRLKKNVFLCIFLLFFNSMSFINFLNKILCHFLFQFWGSNKVFHFIFF